MKLSKREKQFLLGSRVSPAYIDEKFSKNYQYRLRFSIVRKIRESIEMLAEASGYFYGSGGFSNIYFLKAIKQINKKYGETRAATVANTFAYNLTKAHNQSVDSRALRKEADTINIKFKTKDSRKFVTKPFAWPIKVLDKPKPSS